MPILADYHLHSAFSGDCDAPMEEQVQAALRAGLQYLCFTEHLEALSDCDPHDIGSAADQRQVAHRLFDILRKLDQEGMETIYSEVLPPEGVGLAVMNRLGRAAAFRTLRVQ